MSNANIAKIFESSKPWCRDLLQEPVLQDNKIMHILQTFVRTKQLKKVVHFEYFSKEDEVHEVIQCPVFIGKTEVVVYFSTLGISHYENLTYYFVLTAYKPNDDSKLVVLMRTKFHKNLIKSEDENDCYNEYMYDFSKVGQIRLNIKPDRFLDGYRMFGKFAEAAFISTNYGFWNPTINLRFLYGFIEMALALSKGELIMP